MDADHAQPARFASMSCLVGTAEQVAQAISLSRLGVSSFRSAVSIPSTSPLSLPNSPRIKAGAAIDQLQAPVI